MQSIPFASIIVPTFNQADYLREALDSLIAQTDPDWEAIVVNDGSTDHTKDIAESYAARDARIRCLHQDNGGVAEALNAGLRNVRGEWIHWLSSDDLFEPNKLEINRRWIERYPEASFFFSYFTLLRESTGERERRELWGPLPELEDQILTLFYRNYISGISICVRRDAWESIGYFDVGLRYAQDYDQWLRILQRYQARFIPEWTVISRNHAAQGSETFPDACYFDTAKAALRFLNRHTFSELVPWVDLSDPLKAEAAVRKALDVACDRSSFLYCMGIHPALIMRTLEWVFSDGVPHPDIVSLVRSRVEEMSFVAGDDDWTWMWRQIAVSLLAETPQFSFDAIDPTALAVRQWRSMKIESDNRHETMRAYLTRFDKVDPQDDLPEALDRSRIAFLLDTIDGNTEAVTLAVGRLKDYGLRPVLLVKNAAGPIPVMRWIDGIAVIPIYAFDRETLPWLGEVELAVSCDQKPPVWLGALAHATIEPTSDARAIESLVIGALRPKADPLPVVFLERVLWGGGAERVVYDLARHLDRRRYAPKVFTMFDEHVEGPHWPSHIELAKLHPLSEVSTPNASPRPLPVALMRRVYHTFVPLRWRQKLKIRSALTFLAKRTLPLARHQTLSEASTKGHCSVEVSPNAGVTNKDLIDLDFVTAMRQHNPHAVMFARAVAGLGEDTLVISAMEEAAVVSYLAKAAVPFRHIATLHSLESRCLPDMFPTRRRYRAEKHLLTAACSQAQAVTLPTDGCRADLSENFGIDPANIRKIWNPIDCAKIGHLSKQRLEPAERWASENPGFKMIFVGRLDPQKDPELLLDACALLKERGKAFSLAIIGDGWYRKTVEKRISALRLQDHISLAGAQANPFPWIARSDALVLSSQFEAFALVLAEAMACGTPVVSVNCPTGPAEVLAEGAYGVLTEHSAEALADGLDRLMNDEALRGRLRKRGVERAETFDIKNVMPEWEHLIDTVSAMPKN